MTNEEATAILKAKLREFQSLALVPTPCQKCPTCTKSIEAESLKRASINATTNQIK